MSSCEHESWIAQTSSGKYIIKCRYCGKEL